MLLQPTKKPMKIDLLKIKSPTIYLIYMEDRRYLLQADQAMMMTL